MPPTEEKELLTRAGGTRADAFAQARTKLTSALWDIVPGDMELGEMQDLVGEIEWFVSNAWDNVQERLNGKDGK